MPDRGETKESEATVLLGESAGRPRLFTVADYAGLGEFERGDYADAGDVVGEFTTSAPFPVTLDLDALVRG